jgi:hypothetical protein
MDIQIFANFALPPKMNIQIFQNFDLSPIPENLTTMSSEKRTATQALNDEPPAKRHNMKSDEIARGVMSLVKHYNLDEAQKKHLELVAKETDFVPTVDQVNWVIDQANLREGGSELAFHMFPYMEYYPWYLRSKAQHHRLYVGGFHLYNGRKWHLWIGFTATEDGLESHLYLNSPRGDPEHKDRFILDLRNRRLITWWPPYDHLFHTDDLMPKERDEALSKSAAALQNDYFKATMKVLARFPGLVMDIDPQDDSMRIQVYDSYSSYPFKRKEELSASNPLAKLFEVLCTKFASKVTEAKSQEDGEEREGQDSVGNEDEGGLGEGLELGAGTVIATMENEMLNQVNVEGGYDSVTFD